MAEQLTFELPVKPALGRGDFFVSEANAVAVAMLEATDTWPLSKQVLIGGEGSGKTHLVHVWAAQTGARIIPAHDLAALDPSVPDTACAVEDADRIAGDGRAERALLHLHNLLQVRHLPLLITARARPRDWGLSLPDLASRMQGASVVRLERPDEALLGAVMLKFFADRQLQVQPNLLAYLLRRIDRSFAAAGRVVEAMDRAALSQSRALTRSLAATVLDKMARRDA